MDDFQNEENKSVINAFSCLPVGVKPAISQDGSRQLLILRFEPDPSISEVANRGEANIAIPIETSVRLIGGVLGTLAAVGDPVAKDAIVALHNIIAAHSEGGDVDMSKLAWLNRVSEN